MKLDPDCGFEAAEQGKFMADKLLQLCLLCSYEQDTSHSLCIMSNVYKSPWSSG